MLVTFTKKAADEMVERLGKLPFMTKELAKKVTAGTFHSIFLSILRQNRETREIWASSKSREIAIKTILRKLGIDKNYEPEVILSQISNYKNKLIDVDHAPQEDRNQLEFALIWREYERQKQENNFIDFDDMLLECYKLFLNQPDVLDKIRNQYDYILVDEFQDTNLSQYELIKMIAHPKNNLFVVGDDFQVIYSFNGARSENILKFANTYPNAKIIPLEINYRSTDQIVGLGNSVIAGNVNQMKKNVFSVKPSDIIPEFIQPDTAENEAEHIADQIEEAIQSGQNKYKDFAVLYRNNSNSRAIYDELLVRKLPFTIYGAEDIFYETSTVKPIIAYLKLSLNPKDSKSIERILPTLYLGKDKLKYISGQQLKNPTSSPIEHVLGSGLKPFQASKVREKIEMIKRLKNYHPVSAIKMVRGDYEKYLIGEDDGSDTTTLHKEIICETLDELESAAKRHQSVEQFIEFINMVVKNNKIQKEMQKNPDADSIKLMTLHRAKGLEFEKVFILHCSEGVLPHKSALEQCKDIIAEDDYNAMEEERRLMYVGITRAKQCLTISSPQMYRGKFVEPSRFIQPYIQAK
jgi:DNA helicase-2/ATP-dependent DNA helicase PcrA